MFCIYRSLVCLTLKKGAYFCGVIHTELTWM
jgi:hypothetical protein